MSDPVTSLTLPLSDSGASLYS